MSASRMPEVGDVIAGRYELVEPLGHGGFGVVFRAVQDKKPRDVALKLLYYAPATFGETMDAEEFRRRFRREAVMASSLNHPHAVQQFDFGEDGDLFYLAMELVHGETLKQRIEEQGPLTTELVARIGYATLDVLHLAHQKDIVHRDLKPENIMLCKVDGRADFPKVLDFGAAKTMHGQHDLTVQGVTLGSPAYMSPEVLMDESPRPASDLYSLGLTLGEALLGRPVVGGETPVDRLKIQISPHPLDVPVELIKHPLFPWLSQAIEKDPEERYTSAEEMLRALEELDLPGVDLALGTGDDDAELQTLAMTSVGSVEPPETEQDFAPVETVVRPPQNRVDDTSPLGDDDSATDDSGEFATLETVIEPPQQPYSSEDDEAATTDKIDLNEESPDRTSGSSLLDRHEADEDPDAETELIEVGGNKGDRDFSTQPITDDGKTRDRPNIGATSTGERRGLSTTERQGLSTGERRGLSTTERQGLSTGERRGLSTTERQGLSTGERRGLSTAERQGLSTSEREGLSRDSIDGGGPPEMIERRNYEEQNTDFSDEATQALPDLAPREGQTPSSDHPQRFRAVSVPDVSPSSGTGERDRPRAPSKASADELDPYGYGSFGRRPDEQRRRPRQSTDITEIEPTADKDYMLVRTSHKRPKSEIMPFLIAGMALLIIAAFVVYAIAV